jgi:hypothetical protein
MSGSEGELEVINGITPLETGTGRIHPRLFFTAEDFSKIAERIRKDPWKRWFGRVESQAADGSLSDNALVHRLTGRRECLLMAGEKIESILDSPNWPSDIREEGFTFGHMPLDLALAYDWLYGDLESELKAGIEGMLNGCVRRAFEVLARHEIFHSDGHTWNLCAHVFASVAASGLALYGEVDDVGPWLRYVMEKTRLMTEALADDGASPEGICYGGLYNRFYIMTVSLVKDLLGWDFFPDNGYLQSVPYFNLYSMVPRKHLATRSVHLCFGDGQRYNWHGPDYFLRKLAAEYRNPYAQWVADLQEETGATRDGGAFLNLAWADPTVPSETPSNLLTFWHFDDKDVVVMRSGWDGEESVFGFKCGPHDGHKAMEEYPQSLDGHHNAPDAGTFLLFSHGDWLVSEGGYARKFTAYHNTALVNGIGQTGEPKDEDQNWFEELELRRERRFPRVLRADSSETCDYVIGDAAPAYEHEAGLKRFLRHVLYVKPDCWIIADELAASEPSTFDIYFHAWGENFQTDRPFEPVDECEWETGGEQGRLRITALSPAPIEGHPEIQSIEGIGVHRDREMCVLRVRNADPSHSALIVNVLNAFPAGGSPRYMPALASDENGVQIIGLQGAEQKREVVVRPWQEDPTEPALQLKQG